MGTLKEYLKDKLHTAQNIHDYLNQYGGAIVYTTQRGYVAHKWAASPEAGTIRAEEAVQFGTGQGVVMEVLINQGYIVSIETFAPPVEEEAEAEVEVEAELGEEPEAEVESFLFQSKHPPDPQEFNNLNCSSFSIEPVQELRNKIKMAYALSRELPIGPARQSMAPIYGGDMKEITQERFEALLLYRLNGATFHTKRWSNYPHSIYYYREGEPAENDKEIGIFTSPGAWGIFV